MTGITVAEVVTSTAKLPVTTRNVGHVKPA
jgi:hypothetical protein